MACRICAEMLDMENGPNPFDNQDYSGNAKNYPKTYPSDVKETFHISMEQVKALLTPFWQPHLLDLPTYDTKIPLVLHLLGR